MVNFDAIGSSGPKSAKEGSYNWVDVFAVFLEPDAGARQRAREVPLDLVFWDKVNSVIPPTRYRRILPVSSHKIVAPDVRLAVDLCDFVENWCERLPKEYRRALLGLIGQNLGIREAARVFGVDHRRLSEYRTGLQRALKEVS